MAEAFVIMQIGDPELDHLYEAVLSPAIQAAGLKPKRVDKDNEGDVLINEIRQFIESSAIVVADLTNERPNCYLELGYAYGLNRRPLPILTARADHHHEHPEFDSTGPKIHFDMAGYNILFWEPNQLDVFREELVAKIRTRLAAATMEQSQGEEQLWDHSLVQEHSVIGRFTSDEMPTRGWFEAYFECPARSDIFRRQELEDSWRAALTQYAVPPLFTNHNVINIQGGVRGEREWSPARGITKYQYWVLGTSGNAYAGELLPHYAGREKEPIIAPLILERAAETVLFARGFANHLYAGASEQLTVAMRLLDIEGLFVEWQEPFADHATDMSHESSAMASIQFFSGDTAFDLEELVFQLTTPLFEIFNVRGFNRDLVSGWLRKYFPETLFTKSR